MAKEGVNPYIHTGYETEIIYTDHEQPNHEMEDTPASTTQENHQRVQIDQDPSP